jgi:type I restriction enzyme R subunit
MATGSGKTRTVIALVDQLMKAGWVKRVLFLADRTALVNQAANAFKQHLPTATTVNLVTEKITDGRVYVSTYPTMMNLINETTDGLRPFGPGHFDLVVIDEAHRSVYQKYGAIFEWFDSLLVGLTATPKDEVDHNTYRLFQLEDGVPTDAYSLDQAVAEGYLVPPVGVSVPLKFVREGIRYDDLSDEEKDTWDSTEWSEDGEVPDAISSDELNRFLFNEDTIDKVLGTVMSDGHKVAGGDRLGKTIIFARNQEHANFIQRRFDVQWPEHAGHFARVITHGVSYAQSLIDDFSTTEKAPHIAISVDMLDTGIDVPDVCNLVFFKPVRSKSKFWQMIGRGTRLRGDLFGPDQDKKNFYVFDFCGNLEFFSQDLPGSEGSSQKSLGQRIVEARLGLVAALDTLGIDASGGDATAAGHDLRQETARWLHEFVAGMNLDNILVRPERRWVERYAEWETWSALSREDAGEIAAHLGGLPSAKRDDDEDAKRFDLIMLRRQLAQLEGDLLLAERLRTQVQNISAACSVRPASRRWPPSGSCSTTLRGTSGGSTSPSRCSSSLVGASAAWSASCPRSSARPSIPTAGTSSVSRRSSTCPAPPQARTGSGSGRRRAPTCATTTTTWPSSVCVATIRSPRTISSRWRRCWSTVELVRHTTSPGPVRSRTAWGCSSAPWSGSTAAPPPRHCPASWTTRRTPPPRSTSWA